MKGKKISQNKIGNRWIVLTLAVVLALLLSGCVQEKPKVYHVGIIRGGAFAVIADGRRGEDGQVAIVEHAAQ